MKSGEICGRFPAGCACPNNTPRKKSTRAMANTTFKFNRKISLKLHAVFMQAEAARIAALPNSAASATPAMAKAAASSEDAKTFNHFNTINPRNPPLKKHADSCS